MNPSKLELQLQVVVRVLEHQLKLPVPHRIVFGLECVVVHQGQKVLVVQGFAGAAEAVELLVLFCLVGGEAMGQAAEDYVHFVFEEGGFAEARVLADVVFLVLLGDAGFLFFELLEAGVLAQAVVSDVHGCCLFTMACVY